MLPLWLSACKAPEAPPPVPSEPPEPVLPAPVPAPAPTEDSASPTTTGDTGLEGLDCTQPFQRCGGNFRDTTWRFLGVCPGTIVIDSQAFCGTTQVRWVTTYEGTVRFDSNETYRFDLTGYVQASRSHWPPVCAADGCAALEDAYSTCTDDGAGGCFCDQVIDQGPTVLEGDWWIDTYYGQNPELWVGTLYPNGSSSFDQWAWCLDGGELRLRDRLGNVQVLVPE